MTLVSGITDLLTFRPPLRDRGEAALASVDGPGRPGSERPQAPPEPSYYLDVAGTELPLHPGTTLLGRDPRCHVVLSSAGVSRRHASILISGDRAQVADIGSRNGVLVNGVRIEGPRCLAPGDELIVGGHVLKFRAGGLPKETGDGERETVASSRQPPADTPDITLELTERVFQQALAANLTGPWLDAARTVLARIREACVAGVTVPQDVVRTAASKSARIASLARDADWISPVFGIYCARGEVLPPEVIDACYALAGRANLDFSGIEKYLTVMGERRAELTPSERFALARTEGLLSAARR